MSLSKPTSNDAEGALVSGTMRSSLIARLAFKSLVAGLVMGSVLALSGGGSIATAQSIAGFDSNAPVNYAADRIVLMDREKRVVLSGDVQISQADLRMNAGRTTIAYTDQGTLQIQRIDATGGVTVNRGSESARGSAAVYDFNRRLIIMSGGVSLRRGSDTLNGGRLVIDLNTGLSTVDGRASGGSSGRVSGTFQVPGE
jgi:lipopolysaccharide export system protein LptA